MNLNFKKGFVLIEVIIAVSLISIFTIALVSVTQKSLELSDRALKEGQMSFLLEEGAEAVKTIRDDSWSAIDALSLGVEYYLYFDTNTDKWSLSTTPNNIDGFTRKIIFSEVYRDGSDDIAESGTLDDLSKKVDIEVSFSAQGNAISKQLSFYIFDLFN